ncbi:hypothetical protein K438DRAFT_955713 [Mycena galopus ATCC 62051]|nr:hypothetical protein K438DRAFT_955713 [Mycena galopus ATCC 62051]
MNAFDRIVAGRMLFESWAQWNHSVWLAREEDIWDKLQRLSKERIPRSLGRGENIRPSPFFPLITILNNTELKMIDLDSASFSSYTTMDEFAKTCLNQIDEFSDSFPLAKDTMARVLERLRFNFMDSRCAAQSMSAQGFGKRESHLRKRLIADLEHKRSIWQARSELDEMKSLLNSERFLVGKTQAHRCCTRLQRQLLEAEAHEIFGPRTESRVKDIFHDVSRDVNSSLAGLDNPKLIGLGTKTISW